MITFEVKDNALPEPVYRQLRTDYERVLSRGLAEHGTFRDQFVRFNHYDAYMGFPYWGFFTQYDIRSYICDPTVVAERRELMTSPKLSKDISVEMHYHKPGGEAGSPHTDCEWTAFNPARVRKTEPCKGWNIWQNFEPYRTQYPGSVKRVRRIACLVYMNDGWQEGDGGELILHDKLSDGSFVETHRIAPLGNRMVTFLINPSSYHSTAPCVKARRSIVWWYHSTEKPAQ